MGLGHVTSLLCVFFWFPDNRMGDREAVLLASAIVGKRNVFDRPIECKVWPTRRRLWLLHPKSVYNSWRFHLLPSSDRGPRLVTQQYR